MNVLTKDLTKKQNLPLIVRIKIDLPIRGEGEHQVSGGFNCQDEQGNHIYEYLVRKISTKGCYWSDNCFDKTIRELVQNFRKERGEKQYQQELELFKKLGREKYIHYQAQTYLTNALLRKVYPELADYVVDEHYLNLTRGVGEGQITREKCEAKVVAELKKLLPEISVKRLEYRAEELIEEYKNGQLETDGMAAKEQAQELSQVILNGIDFSYLCFRAGIDFLYEQFYFLADAVEERIENGDLSEYARLDQEGKGLTKKEFEPERRKFVVLQDELAKYERNQQNTNQLEQKHQTNHLTEPDPNCDFLVKRKPSEILKELPIKQDLKTLLSLMAESRQNLGSGTAYRILKAVKKLSQSEDYNFPEFFLIVRLKKDQIKGAEEILVHLETFANWLENELKRTIGKALKQLPKDSQRSIGYGECSSVAKYLARVETNSPDDMGYGQFLYCEDDKLNKSNGYPRIETSVDDFKEFRLEKNLLVDKRKSLNLSMLKYFFELEINEKGEPLSLAERSNDKLFADLEISKDQKSMEEQGKYPVILFNLKNTKGDSYQEIENEIKDRVIKLFADHLYLEDCLKPDYKLLSSAQKDKLSRYFSGNINKTDLHTSLVFLSELLYKRFNQKVILLIDEYDETLNDAYVNFFTHKPKEFERILHLIAKILGNALKSNNIYLKKAVLVGILKIAKANIFSGLNNVAEYGLLNKRFTEYYGFTQNEVDNLLTKVPLVIDKNKVKEWYNGYNFGGQSVYNPLSIMRCLLEEGTLDSYWMNSGSTALIDQTLLSDDIQEDLQTLLNGKSITKELYGEIAFEQIKDSRNIFYSLLVFAGYLNPKPTDQLDFYELSIPNREVRKIYKERMIQWVARKLKISVGSHLSLMELLTEKRVLKFVERFKEFLALATSSWQTNQREAESFYNGFFLCLTEILSPTFLITSEQESGRGRSDLTLIPKYNHTNHAFIIEYKVCSEEKDLDLTSEKGLKQIKDKEYNTKVKKLYNKHVMETNKPNQFPSEDTKNTQSNTASMKELDNLAKPSKEK
ncbi:6628_t:CDS:10 [Gigaspora margarita]|uniref:6628_t:CDS:1 n=1 Tax=Gigaspora margarita TaxID=4874 RepID=A0ABN7V2A4_GIGMA|nr:6628_t:CDS:10 [Gigaspora margarita]